MRSRQFKEKKDEGKDPLWTPKWEASKLLKSRENKKIDALSNKAYKRMARMKFIKWFKNIGQKDELVVDKTLAKRSNDRRKNKRK